MTAPIHFTTVDSPLGMLTLAANPDFLCGVYFENHHPAPSRESWTPQDGPRFDAARHWLRAYFSGNPPVDLPPWQFTGGTDFQRRVWTTLHSIPHGHTRSYKQIAAASGRENAVRAVGAAVSRNPLSILIPCHRVIGSRGALTGYAGSTERKHWLLVHEQAHPH